MSEQSSPMTGMADQALRQYQEALRTGLKLQETATRWWSAILTPPAAIPEWQQRFGNLMGLGNGMLPQAQMQLAEMMRLLEQNSRTGSQLLQQSVAAIQTPNLVESQAKWMEVWMTSLDALRSNVQAASQFNTRALDAWLGLTRTATAPS